MSTPIIDSSIGNLLNYYKHERRIFGRCPHCGEAFRLSEVKLTYGPEPPKDLLSRMKSDRDRLEAKLEDLNDKIETLEGDHVDEIDALNTRWKDKVNTEVQRQLVKEKASIRKDAIAKSRVTQLGKTLEKIAPMFPGFGHHPADVRPLFDPIDFVVFDGHFQGEVTDITFVEFKTGQSRLSSIQASIRDAIDRRKVRFEERRLNKQVIRYLTERGGHKPERLVE